MKCSLVIAVLFYRHYTQLGQVQSRHNTYYRLKSW